jgi:hypothetical protein
MSQQSHFHAHVPVDFTFWTQHRLARTRADIGKPTPRPTSRCLALDNFGRISTAREAEITVIVNESGVIQFESPAPTSPNIKYHRLVLQPLLFSEAYFQIRTLASSALVNFWHLNLPCPWNIGTRSDRKERSPSTN